MARYVASTVTTVPAINGELEKIQEAMEDLLSRVGDIPNQMEADLDMNSNRIINGDLPLNDTEFVIKKYVDNLINTSLGNGSELIPGITEVNTLSNGQVIVTFVGVDAQNSIFYIAGPNTDNRRLFVGQDLNIDSSTQITLFESQPANSILLGIQPA